MDIMHVLIKQRRRTHAGAAVLALCFLGAGAAQAGSLSVENASFEFPSKNDGVFTTAVPPAWTTFGSTFDVGVFNPTGGEYPTVPDGVQVGYINPFLSSGGIQQILSDTLASGGHYVLQADFAYRKDCCSSPAFTLALLAGDSVLAAFSSTPGAFDSVSFKTAEASFDTPGGSALIGQSLGIRITGSGGDSSQFAFDNVRLTESISAVPLPLPAMLLGSALAGLVAVRRRMV